MTSFKNKTPRERFVMIGYLCVALPFMVGVMVASAVGYAAFFGLEDNTPLSFLHLIGLTSVMIAAILVGMGVGGWAWAVVGRLFLGISRSDIERMLAKGPQIESISRYNNWCLDVVFGSRKKQGSEDHKPIVPE